jgi:cellulose synthase/poly-beta-1,6-N-acetylglucosamine synthase-like glycosyltransferase
LISGIIALAGGSLAFYRAISLARRHDTGTQAPRFHPKVSLIVPARNEEANIGRLLQSIKKIDYQDLEVIVIDDQSTDETNSIARSFQVRVIAGVPRPSGWGGKQWACQQGADAASGDVLIFSDADTVHGKNSVKDALSFLETNNLDMMSVAPRHNGKTFWEKCTAYFQIMLMFAANGFGKQKPGRAYCIGQYIVFKRTAYDTIGGHASVKDAIVEDVPLANRALRIGLKYNILISKTLYTVRMYDSLKSFIAGWRRNFRAGLKDSSPIATLEVTLIIGALIAGGTLSPGAFEIAGFMLCAVSMLYMVKKYTTYGAISIIGIPFSVALFCLITGLAVLDAVRKKDIIWKGRAITVR